MVKRYRFVVALAVCLCVFAYDTVSIVDDWGGGQLRGLKVRSKSQMQISLMRYFVRM